MIGLQRKYGLTFKSFQPLDYDGPISITDLKTDKVQAADIFTTDPLIKLDGFVSLADPKSVFTAQNIVPLVYRAGVNATMIATLNAVSARLTQDDLLNLNIKLVIDREDQATVAKMWLRQVGLG